ncbi:FkbM family methyltransferase [Chelatococcus daeguensis]|uniref:FkbM family methyltransferase n=1 Tax=Chelatococcus daeguensis TaxID=444444 RepID=UPI001645838B|nr:FkbM family methyltransferase [Chelatococcus daeguensis]
MLIKKGWTCYCGGAGEDISFEVALARQLGCLVYAFDPTPRAIAHVREAAAGVSQFWFRPFGLWSHDTVVRFFAPRNPEHVSFSALNLQGSSDYFDAECRSVDSLMRELDHRDIDLLKLDIEGAEHLVLKDLFSKGIHPKVILFEVDRPVTVIRMVNTLYRMIASGYRLVFVDGWNFSFVKRSAFPSEGAR